MQMFDFGSEGCYQIDGNYWIVETDSRIKISGTYNSELEEFLVDKIQESDNVITDLSEVVLGKSWQQWGEEIVFSHMNNFIQVNNIWIYDAVM